LVTNTKLPEAEVAGGYGGSPALLSSSAFLVHHLSLESCLVSSWKLLLSSALTTVGGKTSQPKELLYKEERVWCRVVSFPLL